MAEYEVKYVHHTLEQAVFDLVCLAYPHVKMKGLVDNLHKDCKDQIERYKKEHRALEIIREKGIDILELGRHRKASTYNEHTKRTCCKEYTDEEFDLIKEMLG